MNNQIDELNSELDNKIAYRNTLLKDDKELNYEIGFLLACLEKIEQLEKEN